jgi:ArsR family transcriptional regulator
MKHCPKTIDRDYTALALELLAQPLRLQVVCLLAREERICVREMMEYFDVKQNLLSHHLGMLKRIGIVDTQRDGVKIYYSLNRNVFHKLKSDLKCLFDL